MATPAERKAQFIKEQGGTAAARELADLMEAQGEFAAPATMVEDDEELIRSAAGEFDPYSRPEVVPPLLERDYQGKRHKLSMDVARSQYLPGELEASPETLNEALDQAYSETDRFRTFPSSSYDEDILEALDVTLTEKDSNEARRARALSRSGVKFDGPETEEERQEGHRELMRKDLGDAGTYETLLKGGTGPVEMGESELATADFLDRFSAWAFEMASAGYQVPAAALRGDNKALEKEWEQFKVGMTSPSWLQYVQDDDKAKALADEIVHGLSPADPSTTIGQLTGLATWGTGPYVSQAVRSEAVMGLVEGFGQSTGADKWVSGIADSIVNENGAERVSPVIQAAINDIVDDDDKRRIKTQHENAVKARVGEAVASQLYPELLELASELDIPEGEDPASDNMFVYSVYQTLIGNGNSYNDVKLVSSEEASSKDLAKYMEQAEIDWAQMGGLGVPAGFGLASFAEPDERLRMEALMLGDPAVMEPILRLVADGDSEQADRMLRAAPLDALPSRYVASLFDIKEVMEKAEEGRDIWEEYGGASKQMGLDALGRIMFSQDELYGGETWAGWVMRVPGGLAQEAVLEADIPVFGAGFRQFMWDVDDGMSNSDTFMGRTWDQVLDLRWPTAAGMDWMASRDRGWAPVLKDYMNVSYDVPLRDFENSSAASRMLANLDPTYGIGGFEHYTTMSGHMGYSSDDWQYELAKDFGLTMDFLFPWEEVFFGSLGKLGRAGFRAGAGAAVGTMDRVPAAWAAVMNPSDTPLAMAEATLAANEKNRARGKAVSAALSYGNKRQVAQVLREVGLDAEKVFADDEAYAAALSAMQITMVKSVLEEGLPEVEALKGTPEFQAYEVRLDQLIASPETALTAEQKPLYLGLATSLAMRMAEEGVDGISSPAVFLDRLMHMDVDPTGTRRAGLSWAFMADHPVHGVGWRSKLDEAVKTLDEDPAPSTKAAKKRAKAAKLAGTPLRRGFRPDRTGESVTIRLPNGQDVAGHVEAVKADGSVISVRATGDWETAEIEVTGGGGKRMKTRMKGPDDGLDGRKFIYRKQDDGTWRQDSSQTLDGVKVEETTSVLVHPQAKEAGEAGTKGRLTWTRQGLLNHLYKHGVKKEEVEDTYFDIQLELLEAAGLPITKEAAQAILEKRFRIEAKIYGGDAPEELVQARDAAQAAADDIAEQRLHLAEILDDLYDRAEDAREAGDTLEADRLDDERFTLEERENELERQGTQAGAVLHRAESAVEDAVEATSYTGEPQWAGLNTPGGERPRELALVISRDSVETFRSLYSEHHIGPMGTILHLRMWDHLDENGQRILMVDEAQGDWAQRSRAEKTAQVEDLEQFSSQIDEKLAARLAAVDEWEAAKAARDAYKAEHPRPGRPAEGISKVEEADWAIAYTEWAEGISPFTMRQHKAIKALGPLFDHPNAEVRGAGDKLYWSQHDTHGRSADELRRVAEDAAKYHRRFVTPRPPDRDVWLVDETRDATARRENAALMGFTEEWRRAVQAGEVKPEGGQAHDPNPWARAMAKHWAGELPDWDNKGPKSLQAALRRWVDATAARDAAIARQEDIRRSRGRDIPEPPLQESWIALAWKAALKYAVENDYDAMAFTTGQTQAERYNKFGDKAEWFPSGGARGGGRLHLSKEGRTVVDQEFTTDEAFKRHAGNHLYRALVGDLKAKQDAWDAEHAGKPALVNDGGPFVDDNVVAAPAWDVLVTFAENFPEIREKLRAAGSLGAWPAIPPDAERTLNGLHREMIGFNDLAKMSDKELIKRKFAGRRGLRGLRVGLLAHGVSLHVSDPGVGRRRFQLRYADQGGWTLSESDDVGTVNHSGSLRDLVGYASRELGWDGTLRQDAKPTPVRPRSGVVEGDEVLVGGNIYKHVYDQKGVATLNRIGKRFGVQVKPGKIRTGWRTRTVQFPEAANAPIAGTPEGDIPRESPGVTGEFNHQDVHRFDIPKELRDSILGEGLYLYKTDEADGAASGVDVIEAKLRELEEAGVFAEAGDPSRLGFARSQAEDRLDMRWQRVDRIAERLPGGAEAVKNGTPMEAADLLEAVERGMVGGRATDDTLALAKRLAVMMRKLGVQVIFTKDIDGIGLWTRSENVIRLNPEKAGIHVLIHEAVHAFTTQNDALLAELWDIYHHAMGQQMADIAAERGLTEFPVEAYSTMSKWIEVDAGNDPRGALGTLRDKADATRALGAWLAENGIEKVPYKVDGKLVPDATFDQVTRIHDPVYALEVALGVWKNSEDWYGWTNHKEFIAEALSNRGFAERLDGLRASPSFPGKVKTIWNMIKTAILKTIGLEPNPGMLTALDEVFEISGRMEEAVWDQDTYAHKGGPTSKKSDAMPDWSDVDAVADTPAQPDIPDRDVRSTRAPEDKDPSSVRGVHYSDGLARVESIIATHPREALVAWAGGVQIARMGGTKNSVTPMKRHIDAIVGRRDEGVVVTHNHPSSGPPSFADVTLAVGLGLQEMRGVGRLGSWRLIAPDGGWGRSVAADWQRSVSAELKGIMAASSDLWTEIAHDMMGERIDNPPSDVTDPPEGYPRGYDHGTWNRFKYEAFTIVFDQLQELDWFRGSRLLGHLGSGEFYDTAAAGVTVGRPAATIRPEPQAGRRGSEGEAAGAPEEGEASGQLTLWSPREEWEGRSVEDIILNDPDGEYAGTLVEGESVGDAYPDWKDRRFKREMDDLEGAELEVWNEHMAGHPDRDGLVARLRKHKGTPWAKQVVEAVFVRAAIMDLAAGREPRVASAFERSKGAIKFLKRYGKEGIFRYLEGPSHFLGGAAKPVNNVNGSFLDCDPSLSCAKYCYATAGRYMLSVNVVKSELITLAIEADPGRAAQAIAYEYKRTVEHGNNKALRLFDKGDISEAWLPVIAELERLGVQVQIFSKRPDILRQVSDQHVRLLSIDDGSMEQADANPDLGVALVYRDERDIPVATKLNERGQLSVVLPIKAATFGKRAKAAALAKVKKTVGALRKTKSNAKTNINRLICPIDSGIKEIGVGKGEWNCTKCDAGGGIAGCFYGQVTLTVKKSIEVQGRATPEHIDALEEVRRKIHAELAGAEPGLGAAGPTDEGRLRGLLGEVGALLDELLSGNVEGPAGRGAGAARRGPGAEAGSARSGRGDGDAYPDFDGDKPDYDANLKRWAGDTKIRMPDGSLRVVYHGSPTAGFERFDISKVNPDDPDSYVHGFWFSTKEDTARSSGRFPWGRPNAPEAEVRSFYLKIENPASPKDARQAFRDLRREGKPASNKAVTQELERRGFDGYVHRKPLPADLKDRFERDGEVTWGRYTLKNEGEMGVGLYDPRVGGHVTSYRDIDDAIDLLEDGTYVAFRSEQIKSTENVGTFDDSDHILYSARVDPGRSARYVNAGSIHELGRRLDIETEDPLFHKVSFNLTGKSKLDDMTPRELEQVALHMLDPDGLHIPPQRIPTDVADANFKEWSKGLEVLTDFDGLPEGGAVVVAHHGSNNWAYEGFDHFGVQSTSYGYFFGSQDTATGYGETREFYVRLENPADFRDPEVFEKVATAAYDAGPDYWTRVIEDDLYGGMDEATDEDFRSVLAKALDANRSDRAVKKFLEDAEAEGPVDTLEDIEEYLNFENFDEGDVEALMEAAPAVAAAIDEALPRRPLELEQARKAHDSANQDWYMYHQDEMLRQAEALGYDSVIMIDPSTGGRALSLVAFDPEQIKSTENVGSFSPNDHRFLFSERADKAAAKERAKGWKKAEIKAVDGLPRVLAEKYTGKINSDLTVPRGASGPGKAAAAHGVIDKLRESSIGKRASKSHAGWRRFMAHLTGKRWTLVPPYKAFDIAADPQLVADQIGQLSESQLEASEHGRQLGQQLRKLYLAGDVDVTVTAEAFLWGALSAGMGVFPQEGAYLTAISRGIEPFIKAAVEGKFDDAMLETYLDWVEDVALQSGEPGMAAMKNLNLYGKGFLSLMGRELESGPHAGRTGLEVVHEALGNPELKGRDIRRVFMQVAPQGSGVGVKIASFVLVVLGHRDVLVLDRVQVRNLWDAAGRLEQYGDVENIYEGYPVSATSKLGMDSRPWSKARGVADQLDGPRALAIYETIEDLMGDSVREGYRRLGRTGDLGDYHWESWVMESDQEVSHGSVEAMARAAEGQPSPWAGASVTQGKLHELAYGSRLGVDADGNVFVFVRDSKGQVWSMTVDQWQLYKDVLTLERSGSRPTAAKTAKDKKKAYVAARRERLAAMGRKYRGVFEKPFPMKPKDPAYARLPWTRRPGVDHAKLDQLIRDVGSAPDAAQRRLFAILEAEVGAVRGGQRRGAYARSATRPLSARIAPIIEYLIAVFNGGDLDVLFHEYGHLLEELIEMIDPRAYRVFTRVLDVDPATGRLSVRGREQLAEAVRWYLRTRTAAHGPLRAALDSLRVQASRLWLTTRGQHWSTFDPLTQTARGGKSPAWVRLGLGRRDLPFLPKEIVNVLDQILSPEQLATRHVHNRIGQRAGAARMPVYRVTDDSAEVGSKKAAEAARAVDLRRDAILAEWGVSPGDDITSGEALDKAMAYVAAQNYRKNAMVGDNVRLTFRTLVPAARAGHIQERVNDRFRRALNGASSEDLVQHQMLTGSAAPDEATLRAHLGLGPLDPVPTSQDFSWIALLPSQASGLRTLANDYGRHAIAAKNLQHMAPRLLDPDADLSMVTPQELNTLRDAMIDVEAGWGGHRFRGGDASPAASFALLRMIGVAGGMVGAGLVGAALGGPAGAAVGAAGAGIGITQARVAGERIGLPRWATKAGRKVGLTQEHVDFAHILADRLYATFSPEKVAEGYIDPGVQEVLEIYGTRAIKGAGQDVLRALAGVKGNNPTANLMQAQQIYVNMLRPPVHESVLPILRRYREIWQRDPDSIPRLLFNIQGMVDLRAILAEGGTRDPGSGRVMDGMSAEEHAAIAEIERIVAQAGGDPTQVPPMARPILGEAVRIIDNGLGRRWAQVQLRADSIIAAFAGDSSAANDASAKVKLTDEQVVGFYNDFYAGRWDDCFRRVSDSMGRKVREMDAESVAMEVLVRLRVFDIMTELPRRLAAVGAYGRGIPAAADALDVSPAGDLPIGTMQRDLFQERVSYYIEMELKGSLHVTLRDGRLAHVPAAPHTGQAPGRVATPLPWPERRRDAQYLWGSALDVVAYTRAQEILQSIGWTKGLKGAWGDPYVFPDGSSMFLPRMVQEELDAALESAGPVGQQYGAIRESLKQLLDIGRVVQGYTRMGVTTGVIIPNPLYFTGNFLGAAFQAQMGLGAYDAAKSAFIEPRMTWAVTARMWGHGLRRPDAAAIVTPDGRIYTADMLMEAFDRGGLDGSYVSAEFAETLKGDLERVFRGRPAVSDIPEFYMNVASAQDNFWRISIAINELKKGKSMVDAIDISKRAEFDYSALSEFERTVLRFCVMFYSYIRNAANLFWHTLLTNPSRVMGQIRLMRGLQEENLEEDPQIVLPDYVRNRLMIDLGRELLKSNVGGDKAQKLFLPPPLSVADSYGVYAEMADAIGGDAESQRQLVGRATPWVQWGAIWAMDKDFFFGRDLSDDNTIPMWFIELDLVMTGGLLVLGQLDMEPQRVQGMQGRLSPNEAFRYVPGNSEAAFAWHNIRNMGSMVPGLGRNLQTLTGLSHAMPGLTERVMDAAWATHPYLVHTPVERPEQFGDYGSRPGMDPVDEAIGVTLAKPYLVPTEAAVKQNLMRQGMAEMSEMEKLLEEQIGEAPTR